MTELAPIPVVTDVEVLDGFVLRVGFRDGTVGNVEMGPRLWGPVFEPLADPELFAQVSVDHQLGTIVWPNGADVAPETLYREVRAARAR